MAIGGTRYQNALNIWLAISSIMRLITISNPPDLQTASLDSRTNLLMPKISFHLDEPKEGQEPSKNAYNSSGQGQNLLGILLIRGIIVDFVGDAA